MKRSKSLAALISVVGMGLLAACGVGSSTPEAVPQQPTETPVEQVQATATERPTVAPAITATPIPTAEQPTQVVATPLPTEQRSYQLCVSIASDSNGYGHVTFQVPDTGEVAITYITPLAVPLEAHLKALGLDYLEVIDRSLSAGGLTIESANYLNSDQYYKIQRDRCKFAIITPFYPDVAVNLARPQDYITNLNWLLKGITSWSPDSRVLVLNFYQTRRAAFTVSNSGRGLTEERIEAFNAELAEECQPGGVVGSYRQVSCVDIEPFFVDMEGDYILAETSRQAYEAALYRTSRYTAIIDAYFEREPDGTIIGDGIHLSLAGRDRLAERLAAIIFALNDDF